MRYERIIYIAHEKNMNGARARNSGIKRAKGEYITFLDDDDFILSEKIMSCVKAINETEYDAVYTSVAFLKDNEITSVFNVSLQGDVFEDVLTNQSFLGTGSNIFIRNLGYLFDEDFLRFQDLEFMIRFLKEHKIKAIEDILTIKDITNSRFYPQYITLKECQSMFFAKFEEYIRNLSQEKKEILYSQKQIDLIYAALASGEVRNVEEARDMHEEYLGEMSHFKMAKIVTRYKIGNTKCWAILQIKKMKHKLVIINRVKKKQILKELNY